MNVLLTDFVAKNFAYKKIYFDHNQNQEITCSFRKKEHYYVRTQGFVCEDRRRLLILIAL